MTAHDIGQRRAGFRALHESGCFVIPNPWDAGSAVRLQRLGFPALASTSAGAAWAMGRKDGELTCDEVLAHLRVLCAATDLPVSADFEAGFATTPEGVAANVTRAAATGIAGLSIEDYRGGELLDEDEAVACLRAARAALDKAAPGVLLTGRCEGVLREKLDTAATLKRLAAYAGAGADCLFAPFITDPGAIREMVAAVAPKPVNVLLRPGLTVADLAGYGARRISVGGALAAAAWKGFDQAAKMLRDQGAL